MIVLTQFPTAFGLPNLSPFCMKVETYLRMTGLEYRVESLGDPRKAPRHKLPFIDDRGRRVPDSEHILAYLKATYGDPLDKDLSPADRALGHTIRRSLEEGFYFVALWSRWMDERSWPEIRRAFFGRLPPIVRDMVPRLARGKIADALEAQGTGRHTPDEIWAIGKADLTALSGLLGDKPFILGEAPTSFDATVYAFAANVIVPPLRTPLSEHAETLPNLRAYCDRMRARYFAGK